MKPQYCRRHLLILRYRDMARGKGQNTLDKGKNSLHVEYCVSDLVHMFPFQQLVDDSYIDSVDDSYIDSISMSRAMDQTRLIST